MSTTTGRKGPKIERSISAQIAEVEREIKLRIGVYAGFAKGSKAAREAPEHLAIMRSVLTTLTDIRDGRRPSRSGVKGNYLPQEIVCLKEDNERRGTIMARHTKGRYSVVWASGPPSTIHQDLIELAPPWMEPG